MKKQYLAPVSLMLLTTAVFLTDVLITPMQPLPNSLYALPVFVAAYLLAPRAIVDVALLSVILQTLALTLEIDMLAWQWVLYPVTTAFVGLLSVLVSAKTRHEAALNAQLNKTNQSLQIAARVVEGSPDMISLIDHGYVYVTVNPTYCRVLGRPISDIEGHPVEEVLGREAFDNIVRPRIDRCFTGESVCFEAWYDLSAAGHRYLEVSYYPLFEGDHVEYAVVVARDATQRWQAEQCREDYVRAISHDLHNPLTSISGMSQWLHRALLKHGLQQEATTAESIHTSAQRMNAMIQELLESTRLEAGHMEMHKEPTDIVRLVTDLAGRTGSLEDRRRIQMRVAAPVPLVRADATQIERAIVNLITNALKYSPPDAPVVVGIEHRGGQALISVQDKGVGISAEEIPHLFERFYRARGARTAEGLGLGLYITRLIAESHGGRVCVESEVGKGSTFYLSLPLA